MFKTIINAWKVKDIRTKMLYTLLLIVVYRLGSFIPVPSVNGEKLGELIASYDFLSFLNLFSGGSLNNFSLFAMGISPYITASIILQLLTIAFPSLEKLSKEEDGREKIEKITRIVGVVLALIQSVSIVVGLNSANGDLIKKITIFGTSGFGTFMNGFMPYVITGICCTAGTAFLMWMGERITEKGIGNGVSILIFASIVSSVPNVVINLINGTFHIIPTTNGLAYKWWYGIVVILVVLILTVGIVTVEKAGSPHSRSVRKARCRQETLRRTVHAYPSQGECKRRYAPDLRYDDSSGSRHDRSVLAQGQVQYLCKHLPQPGNHEYRRHNHLLCALCHHDRGLRLLLLLHHLQPC